MSHDAVPAPVRIPGYHSENPLNRSPELLDERLFWLVHLYDGAQGEIGGQLFGSDHTLDGYVRFQRRVWRRDALPTSTLPLATGHCFYAVYSIGDGDTSVDHLLRHPGWGEADVIAVHAGEGTVPGLSWPELLAAADNGPSGTGNIDSHARLLLLPPACADGSARGGAVRRLAAALRARVGAEAPEVLASAIVERWSASGPVRWRTTGAGVRVNDGTHSFRNPDTFSALAGASLARVSAALAP
ncbi:hypothetical protein KGD83_17495 [Nocardiopsis akebiae]|uniref:Uncharacterized protein n=1 Tax=Nocardiopsis akebiae TaxID=2831968 RepID=A0ABX8BYT0_9ACTN|nr:hypothetical protein [Nocardiopsis akebiae]QUX27132.1 hypothetical protein KGD83_17495 [Nocardiopsis akebiae]